MTHFYLWKQLLNDHERDFYLIMEDDFELCKNFKEKIEVLNSEMKEKPIIFLGYHMFEHNRKTLRNIYNVESKETKIVKLDKNLYHHVF